MRDHASLSDSPSLLPRQEYDHEDGVGAEHRAALTEHNPSLKWRRIQEAHKAIMLRITETEATSDEREKLDNAIDMLDLLRNRM